MLKMKYKLRGLILFVLFLVCMNTICHKREAMTTRSVIVVGTGLAGLSATHQLIQNNVPVILLEKMASFGGNSIKASSGVSGVPTSQQILNNIRDDSPELFYQDLMASANTLARPDLLSKLSEESGDSINWLSGNFGVDLDKVTLLGGHSRSRTHRGAGALPPGFAIISALTKKLQEAGYSDKVEVLKNSKVLRLIKKERSVVGVEYQDVVTNQKKILNGPVILSTGGFSADFNSRDSLLKRFRPDLAGLPSSNGNQATGDGQRLCVEVGAQLIDMAEIQVHPTGFIDPEDPTSKWKFLAGEALRGVGGILVNDNGVRFVNELTTRDVVTSSIYQNTKYNESLIIIGEEDYNELNHHIDFYMKRGLMSKTTIKELAASLDIKPEKLLDTIKNYNKSVMGVISDPFGRKNFGKPFDVSLNENTNIYHGIVTPVIHYTMGGVKINPFAEVLDTNNEIIPGLLAAGEVTGGVHGMNRLGGSSLLECVVFGRAAANSATFFVNHDRDVR